jgi:hypothetical protein
MACFIHVSSIVMMSTATIIIIAALALILMAVFAECWCQDVKKERFRANLKPGQRVRYSKGPFLYHGIVLETGNEAVRLIDITSMNKINVSIWNIYEL